MTGLVPQDIIDGAHAVKAIVNTVPAVKDAVREAVNYWVTDRFRYARAKRNLEHTFEMADKMTKGMERSEDVSCRQAEDIIKACIDEDREELQKLWAALIARVITGQNRIIRTEWFDIIRKLNPIDALVIKSIHEHEFDELTRFSPINIDDIGKAIKHKTSLGYERIDIKLSSESLIELGCVEYGEDIEDERNSWLRKSYCLTIKGCQIAKAVTAPIKDSG